MHIFDRIGIGVIVIVSVVVMFFRLGDPHLSHWDEAWYADVSRTMAESGDIDTPIWNTQPFFEKPPLYFWASAIAYSFIPDEELSARFFSAVAGVLTILIVYFFAYRYTQSHSAGIVASSILLSSIGYIFRARTGNLDVFHSLWIVLSLIFYIRAYHTRSQKDAWVCGSMLVLAFLSKGYSGLILIPIVLLMSFSNVKKHLSTVVRIVAMTVAGIGLWIVWFYSANGMQFIQEFFFHQSDKFLGDGSIVSHFSFDIITFIVSGLKWMSIMLALSLVLLLKKFPRATVRILLIYCCTYGVVFSFIESKNNWLLVPLYPVIALIIGMTVYRIKYISIVVFLTAMLQVWFYKTEYIVPDVVALDARVAQRAAELTQPQDLIYTSNSYFPALVYYSKRKTYAVFGNRSYQPNWWILPESRWDAILAQDRITVVTTEQEYAALETVFSSYGVSIVDRIEDRLILRHRDEES